MQYSIIKSNHGNHSGFNRKWTLLNSYLTEEEAKSIIVNVWATSVTDNYYLLENGDVLDTNSNKIICFNGDKSFSYDGCHYTLVSLKDVENYNGGSYGYLSQEILSTL